MTLRGIAYVLAGLIGLYLLALAAGNLSVGLGHMVGYQGTGTTTSGPSECGTSASKWACD